MSWFLAFAGFAALVILHEFGHFIVAKWTGMRVERFFLFFPPKLWSIKRGETEYGIGAIPAGGFVKITGMNPDELEPKGSGEGKRGEDHEGDGTPTGLLNRIEAAGQDPEEAEALPPEVLARGYYNQPVWKRVAVIAAGPVMNLLIAFLILFFLALGVKEATTLEVGAIESDTPAEGVLMEGDTLVSVDGVAAPTDPRPSQDELGDRADALATQVNTHTCPGAPSDGCAASTPAAVVVERDGERKTLELAPFYDADAPPIDEGDEPGRYRLGFGFQGGGLVAVNPSAAEAADRSLDFMWFVTSRTVSTIAQLFKPEKREEVSSVVGGYEATRQAIELDTRTALTLIAVISLSLAIINLFPFLPLDGGHIFWSLLEKVRGRRASFATMERAGAVGFMLILFLFFIGLSNDIDRLTGEGFGVR